VEIDRDTDQDSVTLGPRRGDLAPSSMAPATIGPLFSGTSQETENMETPLVIRPAAEECPHAVDIEAGTEALDLLYPRDNHSHTKTTGATLAPSVPVMVAHKLYPQIEPEFDNKTETGQTGDDLFLQQPESVADDEGWMDVTTSMPDLSAYQLEVEMKMATARSLPGSIPTTCTSVHQKLDSQTVCLDSYTQSVRQPALQPITATAVATASHT